MHLHKQCCRGLRSDIVNNALTTSSASSASETTRCNANSISLPHRTHHRAHSTGVRGTSNSEVIEICGQCRIAHYTQHYCNVFKLQLVPILWELVNFVKWLVFVWNKVFITFKLYFTTKQLNGQFTTELIYFFFYKSWVNLREISSSSRTTEARCVSIFRDRLFVCNLCISKN